MAHEVSNFGNCLRAPVARPTAAMSAKPEEPCVKPSKKCGLCGSDAGGDDGQGYPFPEPILYRARGSVCCEACYEDNEDLLETARVPVPGPSTGEPCCLCDHKAGLGNNPYPLGEPPAVCCDACNVERVMPARVGLAAKSRASSARA
jgi:hypothetical protein